MENAASKQMPKVSVLTPIYNTPPQYLRECIESVLKQTFTDFEFLILNDSPENKEIEQIVKSYKDGRIKYFKNEKNLGISESRNKLLDMAKGKYLAILDHDDICCPERLEKEVSVLDKNKYIGVVSSWLSVNNIKIWRQPEFDADIRIGMTGNCAAYHTAAMIRKSVLTANNIRYNAAYTPAEDYHLWYQLMFITKFYNIQKPLVSYRCYKNNTSYKYFDKQKRLGAEIEYMISNDFPAYRKIYDERKRKIKIRLFGFIPFLKYKKHWVYLFDFIPLFRLK